MKIFKQKEYRYRLELSEPTETLLYKERNFNLKIKLVDSAGNEISNSKNSITQAIQFLLALVSIRPTKNLKSFSKTSTTNPF